VTCGHEHVQAGRLDKQLQPRGNVEVYNITKQPWFNLNWTRLPHDQSIVDGWVEQDTKKNLRLGRTLWRK